MAIAQHIEIDESSDYLKQCIAKDVTGTVTALTGSEVRSQVRKSDGTYCCYSSRNLCYCIRYSWYSYHGC